MALDAGSVFVRLGGLFDDDGFRKWDAAVDSERTKARTPVEAKLGADSSPLDRVLGESKMKLSAWGSQEADARVGVDDNFLTRSLAAAETRLRAWESVGHGSVKVDVELDTTGAEIKLAALKAEAAALNASMASPGGGMISRGALGRLASGHGGGVLGTSGGNVYPMHTAGLGGPGMQGPIQGTSQPWFAAPGAPRPMPRDPASGRFLNPTSPEGRAAMPWWFGGAPRGGFTPPPAASADEMRSADEAFMRAELDRAMRASIGGGGGGGGGDGGGGGGGGDSGGGFGDSAGRFLFGAGVRSRRGRFLGALSPFQMGLHGPFGAIGGAIGLGPEHLLSAAAAVGGSAAGGLAGAGVTALGALGTMAVGSGSDLAVIKSTISDTQTLGKAYDALTTAQERYGKGSTQAKIAQFELNQAMDQLGGRNGVGVKAELQLHKMTLALGQEWRTATQNARVQAVGLLEQILGLGKDYIPRVAQAAEQNLAIINKGIKPLFDWLEGPHGVKIWNDLENQFKANLPNAVHAFVQGVELLLKVIDDASKYTGGFTRKLDEVATRWNNMDPRQLSAKIAKLHADFRLWESVIINVAKDLGLLFKAGSGEGNTLVAMFDKLLIRWGAWERSARGQTALHEFFKQREQELVAILHLVGDVIKIYGSFWAAFQPLVPAVTAFAKEMASGLSSLITNVVQPIAGAINWVLKGFVELGKESSIFRDGFIVPFGAFLIAWRLFGRDSATQLFNLRSHLEVVGRLLVGMRAATAAIFAGEGVGGAWQRLKDAMKPSTTGSPAASMEEGIVAGSKTGAALIQEAIIAGHREGAALVEAGEVAGGKAAGAEIGGAEALGGAAGGAGQLGLFGKGFGSKAVAGEQLSLLGADAAGVAGVAGVGAAAAKGGLFSRLAGMKGGLGGGLLIGLGGGIGAQMLGQAIGGNAGRQVSGYGSAAATGAGIGFTIGGPVGALAGAGIGSLAHLATQINQGPNFNAAQTTRLLQQGGADIGSQLSNRFAPAGGLSGNRSLQTVLQQWQKEVQRLGDGSKTSSAHLRDLAYEGDALAKIFPKSAAAINQVVNSLRHVEAGKDAWNTAFNRAYIAVHDFSVKGGNSIKNIKDRFDTNMRLIQSVIGLHSEAGRKLAEANFNEMMKHVESAMKRGRISVADGIKYMRDVANHGTQGMRDDLSGHYDDIVGIIHDSWKKGKTNTQTALKDLRQVINDANKTSRADIVAHYKQLLQDNYNQWKSGNETTADAAKKRAAIHRQMAADLQATQVKLSGGLAHILDGTNIATAKGVDKLFSVLNDALKKLNVTEVKWGVSNVGNVVQSSLGSIFKSVANFGGNASIPSGVPTATNLQAAGFYGGGILPGREYGLDDNMTLVDPMGRPRAKMAGDEGIVTRHQMPVIDYALNVAKTVGALPYGSLDEVWSNVTRPHGYERGGKLRRFAQGGKAGYVFPFGPGLSWGRTDMGLDMAGSGLIGAIGNAVITRATPQGDSTGWPGGAGDGAMIVQQLTDGPDAGRYVYLAENVDPLVRQGQRVTAGQAIAHARGFYPFLEMGWAANASGTTLAAATTGYHEGQVTISGADFTNFIHGLAHGKIVGGGLGFGAVAPQWQNIQTPHLTGASGPLANLGNGVLKHVTDAANKFGQAHMPAGTPSSGGGGSAGVALPGGWWRIGATIDPTGGQTGDPNFTFAELLEAGANAGMRPDMTQLLGMPRGQYGMPMGSAILIRGVGSNNQFRIIKNDVGSGQAGNAHYKIDLHPGIARAIGWVPNNDVEIKHAARGGRLNGFAKGGQIGRMLDFMLHGHFDPNKQSELDPAALQRFGINPRTHHSTGGILNFARGGRQKYSLYTPPKPPSKTRQPKVFHAKLPASIAKYVGVIPGATQFSADDASITRLEDMYSRQEALYTLYDGGSGQLPAADLDQLYGIRKREWDILSREWLSLPGFLSQIQDRLSGHWEGHWQTGSGWKTEEVWRGTGKNRHKVKVRVPVASIGSPTRSHHPIYQRDRYDPGLRKDVQNLQHQLDSDDKEISSLNDQLYKEHVQELKQKRTYTTQAYNIANGIASQVANLLGQIYNNLDSAHNITDEISAIQVATPAESLQGLTGPAYAAGQQQNASNKAGNYALTVRRHNLSRQREQVMKRNVHLHHEIRNLENQKSAAARRLHHEGFMVAWTYELDRLAIGERIRHIRLSEKELRDKLKDETKLLNEYEAAQTSIEGRLYGATAEDPTATGLRSTMGDVGMDILSLNQEGANVPGGVIQAITAILTGDPNSKPPKGLGLKLPPGFGTGASQTAAQAVAEFMAFQASRQNLFAQFGSNFVQAGSNPFPGTGGLAAGTQYYGAASGAGSGVPGFGSGGMLPYAPGGTSKGDTNITITQHFGGGPADPHTYASGLQFELGAMGS